MEINSLLENFGNLIVNHLGELFSFILGAAFTIGYTYFQRRNQSKNLRKLYLKWYSLSKSSIINQINLLKTYIEELEKDSVGRPILKLNNLRIEVLLTFEYEKLFQAFVYDHFGKQDEHAKQIFQLTGNVQYLVTAVSAIKTKFETSQTQYQDWQNRFNSEMKEFNELIFEYYHQYLNIRGDFVERITAIKEAFKENHEINPPTDKVISEMVMPIEEVIHDHFAFENDSILVKSIKNKTQKLQILETEKIQLTKSIENIFSHYIHSIEKALMESDRNYNYFSSSKFNFFRKFKKRFLQN